MRTYFDPPLSAWRPTSRPAASRDELARVVRERARRLGTPDLDVTEPLIATGHQAWLWHPGILAKDIAADVAADRFGAGRVHLVVDQDVHSALEFTLPRQEGDRLTARQVRLAPQRRSLPTGFQPPADPHELLASVHRLEDPRLAPLAEASSDLPDCRSLAEQVAVILARLRRPVAGELALLFVSDLPKLAAYRELLEAMLADAVACAKAYNEAVAAWPEAGVGPLTLESWRVELPLWVCRWGEPRRRVYADLADSGNPIFVDEAGEPVGGEGDWLLPRALLLSAAMRRFGCELFIHGKGGGIYDRATETWWASWQGSELAPGVVVSADLHLDCGAPVADRAQRERAVWHARYVRYNVDRLLGLDSPRARQKRRLIEQMDQHGDRMRKWLAFREIERFNRELQAAHPEVIAEADQRLRQAEAGVANRAIAGRRDWPFVLYPPDALASLRQAMGAGEVARRG
ncbi:MAG: hypothetical protein ACLFVN_01475 [Phycisphaeraceae bacterium]